jgi:hypothetical protein
VKNVSVKKTSKRLWETKMPFAQNATRATYEVGDRQFIVIATSGARIRQSERTGLSSKSGAACVAFALPQNHNRERGDPTEMKRSKNISRRTALGMGGALTVSPLLQGQPQQEPAVPEPLMFDLASEPPKPGFGTDASSHVA